MHAGLDHDRSKDSQFTLDPRREFFADGISRTRGRLASMRRARRYLLETSRK
jgi:hypothetical protein